VIELEAALGELVSALDALSIPYALIGGLATGDSTYTEPLIETSKTVTGCRSLETFWRTAVDLGE
jgi:hypothetical protein